MISDFFDTDFSVIRVIKNTDTGGAIIETLAIVDKGKSYLQPLSGNERIQNSKPEAVASYRLFCETSIDVNEKDRIRINGRDMEILHIADYLSGKNPHKEIILSDAK